jgi:hypothetical protein
MRVTYLAAIPVLAALSAAPASAQVSARLHIDVPIGRRAPVIYGAPRRQVTVREYDPSLFGAWDSYYDDWAPVTMYYYDGYYYDYPIVEYAEPILVYSYRNQFFLPPRDRGFETWRREFRGGGNFRGSSGFGRDVRARPIVRDERQFRSAIPRDGRDGRQFQGAPRNGADGRQFQHAPGDGRNGRQFQPAPGGRNGRQVQPAPGDGRNGRQYQGAPQSRGNGGNGRDARQGGNRGNGGHGHGRP